MYTPGISLGFFSSVFTYSLLCLYFVCTNAFARFLFWVFSSTFFRIAAPSSGPSLSPSELLSYFFRLFVLFSVPFIS